MAWQRINIENHSNFKALSPMQIFFNAVPDKEFSSSAKALTEGYGDAIEGITGCFFPRDLDEYEVYNGLGFDGIQFTFYDEEVVVDVPTFRKYLKMACDAYLQEHPKDRKQIEEYLARPQPPLEEGTMEEWRRRRNAGEYSKPLSDV